MSAREDKKVVPGGYTLAALVHTLNEERNIASCLASVRGDVDEIVVVDMHSEDRTAEIARSLGARVIFHDRAGCVEPARNFGLAQVTADWALVLDADEEAGRDLVKTVREVIGGSRSIAAVAIPRRNIFLGRWMKHAYWPDWQLRAFRRGAARWSGLMNDMPVVDGAMAYLPAREECAIWHNKATNLEAKLVKAVKYSKVEASQRVARGERPAPLEEILCHTLDTFTGRFCGARGFEDGMQGLLEAWMDAEFSFMVQCHMWDLLGREERDAEMRSLRSRAHLVWGILRTKLSRRVRRATEWLGGRIVAAPD